MSALDEIKIELSVVLGLADVPIRQILQMSRGAMIQLNCTQDDPSLVYANDELVATGRILVDGEFMSLEVSEIVRKRND